MAVFIKNNSAFKKNVEAFEAKRRGVLKKRLGVGNHFPLWRFALFLRISAFIFAAPEP